MHIGAHTLVSLVGKGKHLLVGGFQMIDAVLQLSGFAMKRIDWETLKSSGKPWSIDGQRFVRHVVKAAVLRGLFSRTR